MPPSAFVNIRRASCASHLAAGLHTAPQQILKMQQRVLLYGIHLPAEASPGIVAEIGFVILFRPWTSTSVS